MYIKTQTVIPAGTKITKCPPRKANGKNIWTLLVRAEKKAQKETELKQKVELFTKAIKAGHSAADALSLIKDNF